MSHFHVLARDGADAALPSWSLTLACVRAVEVDGHVGPCCSCHDGEALARAVEDTRPLLPLSPVPEIRP